MNNLSQQEWSRLVNEDPTSVILDVRTAAECAEGIIPGAMTIDIMNPHKFSSEIRDLDKSKTYFVYCRSGARSGQACQMMAQDGFKCYNLSGGILSWTGEVTQPAI